jgi:uncharacterized membrane protein (DUF2068 family)
MTELTGTARGLAGRMPATLSWIIAFEAFKALALAALGVALLTTRHADPVDLLIRFALAVHLPLTSRLLDRVLTFLANLTVSRQMALAISAFAYALLMGTEGVALYFRHPWARWFTIVATASLIPLEIYELVREPHPTRFAVLVVNAAVVIYLVRRRDIFDA